MAVVSTSRPAAYPRLALILVAAISVLWGMNWPAMKFVVGELDPWTFRVLCVFGAGFTLLLLARFGGEPVMVERRLVPALIGVSLFAVTGWHMLTAYGLEHVGGGRAAIVAFTMPLWATMMSFLFLKEPIDRRKLLGMASGLAGIGLLVAQSFADLGNAPFGTFLILLAAICWAIGTIGTKAIAWNIGTLALSGWYLVIGGIPILMVWLALEAPGDFSRMTPTGVFALLYVTFVALVFCFTSFLRIVRLLPASVAAISTLAIPVVGVIGSGIFLGEAIGWREAVAMVLVLTALALVLLPTRKPA